MNGYEKRTEQKKESILETAQSMFFKFGYQQVSMIDIAKKANVSKVTIFNYYGSKEILAREMMKRYINNYLCNWNEILNKELSFIEKMELIFSIDNPKSQLLTVATMSQEAWKDPFIRQLYEEESTCLYSFLVMLFQEGKDKGEFDNTVPNDTILDYLQAMSSLITSEKYNSNSEYIVGMYKLFCYGLFDNIIS
jgi:Transcriptional regulator